MSDYNLSQIIGLLHEAHHQGVTISYEADELLVETAEDIDIDEGLLDRLRDYKPSLLAYFRHQHQQQESDVSLLPLSTTAGMEAGPVPLSFGQERMWFIDQVGGSVQYHIPLALRINGVLNISALEHAFRQVITRHAILRTVIKEDAGSVYQVLLPASGWRLCVNEEVGSSATDERLKAYIADVLQHPFDLSGDYMLRAELIKLTATSCVLVIAMHHIASDGWSTGILVQELVECYSAALAQRVAELPELPVQYGDYAIWQRRQCDAGRLVQQLDYWRQQLGGVQPLLLPTDHLRPAVQSIRGGAYLFEVDALLKRRLYTVCQQQEVTLFMLLLSVFKVLLYRYSGQTDICVGTPVAGRSRRELEGLIGLFINTLALRSELQPEESFSALLRAVKHTTIQAYERQEVPFERVVEEVEDKRDLSRNPVYQVVFGLQNVPPAPALSLGDVVLSQEEVEHTTSKFDVRLSMEEYEQGIYARIEYRTDLFEASTVARMGGHYLQLLAAVTADADQAIGQLSLLTTAERSLLDNLRDSTDEIRAFRSVPAQFATQALLQPASPALVFGEQQYTYAQAEAYSSQLAMYLRSQGIGAGSLVPVCMERSAEMIIAILAVLKSGAAYVPLEPDYPEHRLQYVLSDTAATMVLVSRQFGFETSCAQLVVPSWLSGAALDAAVSLPEIASGMAAYVIYTSGSTGTPKGVIVSHGNLHDYLEGLGQRLPIAQCRSYALVSSIATDLGNTVLYASLVYGGVLHLFSRDMINDGDRLTEYFALHRIDCLKIVPSHWRALSAGVGLLLPVRLLIFGGELLERSVVEQIWDSGSGCVVANHYGPTETTIGKLLYVVSPAAVIGNVIPIGYPFGATRVYVLSAEGQRCPVGVPGELYIGGDGVALGYLHQDVQTAARFIADPVDAGSGIRFYRTGDRVKYLSGGAIVFLGRVDEQVKIRGYRVEPGEVGSILQAQAGVSAAVVVARADHSGVYSLHAYLTVDDDYDAALLWSHIRLVLPEHLHPATVTVLPVLPQLPNGKIDKQSLPDPIQAGRVVDVADEVWSPLQLQLRDIWSLLLEESVIGLGDDFFSLGGHSLLAIRLISSVRKELGVDMSIGEVFDHPTLSGMSGLLSSRQQVADDRQLSVQARPMHIPLSYSQERLWFIDQLEGSVHYHIPVVLRLRGVLDIAALSYALRSIVNRHEVLRTVMYTHDGIPYQQVLEKDQWELSVISYQGGTDDIVLADYLQTLTMTPFDLSRDHMLRAQLLITGIDEYLLVVTLHHIASDGWSNGITVRELSVLYNAAVAGEESMLASLPLQYADYAIWQRQHFSAVQLAGQLGYWQQQLDKVAALEIQTDLPRRQVTNRQGDGVGFQLDSLLSEQLTALSQAQGVTLFMTLLAAFKVLLYRYTGQSDICVGTATAGRTRQETENLIGFFINSLALRSTVSGEEAFEVLLQQVKQTTLDAYAHQDVPFEQVVDAVVQQRDTYRTPLFQVLFILQNVPGATALQLGDIIPEEVYHGVSTTQFELSVTLSMTEEGLSGSIIYATDLFERDRIARMLVHYEQLLRSIVSDVQQPVALLPMLGAGESAGLLAMSRHEAAYPKEVSLVALLDAQALRTPDHIAVTVGSAGISYAMLHRRANQLAHYLRSKGVGTDVLVPICLGRSIDMVVGILGILKAGGAYVPVDPDYPFSRIAYILEDTQASVVVSSSAYRHLLPSDGVVYLDEVSEEIGRYAETGPLITIPASSLAYIIYTSGSTGRPKGVMITHENVVRLFEHEGQLYDFGDRDVWTLFHSFSFDFSVWELYGGLLYGGRVVLVSREEARDTAAFASLLSREGVTVLNQTPAAFYLLQEQLLSAALPLALRYVIFGGEALDTSRLVGWLERYPAVALINMYGITETTVHVSYQRIGLAETSQGSIIGHAIPTLDLYVLDGAQQLCPIGVPGELCVGGAGLARGYLHQPALTASRFIAGAPLAGIGDRLYRSGDLGYRRGDGHIVYLGRIDDQVKIRGYRIEPGEIARVLQEHVSVSAALVTAPVDSRGDRRLVGYVVSEGVFDETLLLGYLQERLPAHMIPSVLLPLSSIPLTSNGKVDRAALPLPEEAERRTVYASPRTDLERQLAGIWEELLQIREPGIHDNFFERGGHSLLAIRLVAAIRKTLQLEVPVRYIFDHPTIAGLGIKLTNAAVHLSLPLLERADRMDPVPLSYSQERLWFIDQLEGSQHYHVPIVLRISGPLNRGVLAHSLQLIVNRHETLRTVIVATPAGNYQQVLDSDCWQLDILSDPRFADADYRRDYIRQLVTAPFDLGHDHMLRGSLLILSPEEHILVLTIHHLAYDGWSSGIFSRELTELYNAYLERRPAQLPSLAIQYADYAIWQRRHLSGEEGARLLSYWERHLAGVMPLALQTDLVRPVVPGLRGDTVYLLLDASLTAALQQLSQAQGVTLFMTLLTAFKVLLYRYSGQADICVGTIVAGRTQQETEGLIGFFVNTLALRSQVDGAEGYNKLLQQVKQTVLDAYAYQDAPFEQVLDAVVKERDMSRAPLFQVLFLLQQYAAPATLALSGLTLSGEDSDLQAAKFDLTLTVEIVDDGLSCGMLYATDLFERDRIVRMLVHYEQLLRSIVSDVQQPVALLPMLGAGESAGLLAMSRHEAAYPKEVSLVALLDAQALRTPDHIAVTVGSAGISYAMLHRRANQLAHYLRSKGVGTDVLVPICLGRSIDMVVGILGILKAGGAYVPVDPDYPFSRIAYILEDTQASVVVSSSAYRHLLPSDGVVYLDEVSEEIGRYAETGPLITIPASSLAYIIYTSGSTGRPKGVMITHENVVRLFEHEGQLYDFGDRDVWTLFHSFSFDFSVWELYGGLLYGGRVVLVSREEARDTAAFASLLSREGVTVLNQTPAAFYLLQEQLLSAALPLALRYVIFGGEALDTSRLVGWLERYPAVALINMYGITETTVHVSYQRIGLAETSQGSIIGHAIPTLDLYVLDGAQQLCPIGVPGELCVGGAGLARGYLHQPALTASRFIAGAPLAGIGDRLYRSGDLGYRRGDGHIVYLGRIDDQVKIRGYRIEPGEIARVLQEHVSVSAALVTAPVDSRGDRRLVGYVVSEGVFDETLLLGYLQERLPAHMIPSVLLPLSSIPLTSNGKVDRAALPLPEEAERRTAYVAPRTDLEHQLASIWEELLQIREPGIYDNFFERGGHSFAVIRLSQAIQQQLHTRLLVRDIYMHPTIAALSAHIISEGVRDVSSMIPIPMQHSKHLLPLNKTVHSAPLFIVPGSYGVSNGYDEMGRAMEDFAPVYGIQLHGVFAGEEPLADIPAIAAQHITWMRELQPEGPYRLIGHSFGGYVAYEMVRQLEAMGMEVGLLVILDTTSQPLSGAAADDLLTSAHVTAIMQFLEQYHIIAKPYPQWVTDLEVQLSGLRFGEVTTFLGGYLRVHWGDTSEHAAFVLRVNELDIRNGLIPYRPEGQVKAPLLVVKAATRKKDAQWLGWDVHAFTVDQLTVSGDHHTMILEASALQLARYLQEHYNF